jgi:PAS domain S-box-containing protein
VLTTNAQEDPRFGGHESIVAYNLRSILCVPLKLKSEIIGAIYADNRIRSGIFTEYERDLLNAFANQSAVAIENARLFASVRASLAEVSELKNLMDNIFASIANGVMTTDSEERITLCNRAAADILGYSRQDLLGQHLDTVLPSIAVELSALAKRVRAEQRTLMGVELTPRLPNRGEVELRMNLSPLIDVDQSAQGVAIVLDDLTERRQLEARWRLFARMVSPAVIEQLNPDEVQLGGERTQLTTLFTDIRGFTHLSERISPDELVNILNIYLSAAADAILDQRGTIDKFMGDAVMAWFNAPIPQADHALRAVQAALDIQEVTTRLHEKLPPEYHLVFGTGIHAGEVVLGLIGTQERLDYTAIGDSVNTAKRIQEAASDGQILISAEIYNLVCELVQTRKLDEISVKGKSQPIQVYEVLGINT